MWEWDVKHVGMSLDTLDLHKVATPYDTVWRPSALHICPDRDLALKYLAVVAHAGDVRLIVPNGSAQNRIDNGEAEAEGHRIGLLQ